MNELRGLVSYINGTPVGAWTLQIAGVTRGWFFASGMTIPANPGRPSLVTTEMCSGLLVGTSCDLLLEFVPGIELRGRAVVIGPDTLEVTDNDFKVHFT